MANSIVLSQTTTTHVTKGDDILWVTDFTDPAAQTFCKSVMNLSKKNRARPILVYIDSYGGSVDALLSMLTVLDAVPNKIITIATGKAMSAGAVLLSHGDIRFVSEHCRVMVHEASGGTYGHIHDAKIDIQEFARLNVYLMGLLAKNCGYTYEEFRVKFTNEQRDIYMNANQALKFGIADKIGIPELKCTSSWEISARKDDK